MERHTTFCAIDEQTRHLRLSIDCQCSDQICISVTRKLSGYLLDTHHPFGRSKALFFNTLGYKRDKPDVLRRALLQHAADNAVSSIQLTPFGAKYLIEGRISGPTGSAAAIRSVWFVEIGERRPRFVTAYPLRGTQK